MQHRDMRQRGSLRSISRPGLPPIVFGVVAGTLLVVTGVWLGFLVFATPMLTPLLRSARPDTSQMLIQMFTWGLAFAGPGACVLLGAGRWLDALTRLEARHGSRSRLARQVATRGSGLEVATTVDLGDGRPIPELVVGPFGAAVVRELPPRSLTRHDSRTWELRTRDGWIPIENPLERAARDADRVRRWFALGDEDFVVKVYAAVVGGEGAPARTATCAVLTPDQVAGWLASLPAQRSLTAARRDRLMAKVRGQV
jgi:hypothetical protein